MVTDINALDNLVTLLTANYNSANADSITPTIAKVYTQPKMKEPRPNEDFVYVYNQLTTKSPVGIGATTKAEIIESIKIDIRSKPANTSQSNLTNDAHARKVLTEVERVLYSNVVNPDSDFDILDPNVDIVDLSNGSRGIFRYVLTVNLIKYCRDMTT